LERKLHALGCKTMLLGWDFEFTDEQSGELQTTRTSTDLWNEVTYPLEMAEIVDQGLKDGDAVVKEMFVVKESVPRDMDTVPVLKAGEVASDERFTGDVMSLHNGYGFIRFPENNLFFLHEDLVDVVFTDLKIGDLLSFTVAVNARGQRVAKQIGRAED
jgi:hypothetical protein